MPYQVLPVTNSYETVVLTKNQQNIVQYFLFRTFFEKYRQKYRGTFDFQVPSTGTAGTFNKVPNTGTAGTLKKYRAHLYLKQHADSLQYHALFFSKSHLQTA